ncbi:MAG TPA: exosortase/archaeosortase family protein [Candidatus Limnocylindria bacterium]
MSPPTVRSFATRTAVAWRDPLRAAAVVGLVILAYNYSLSTLVRGMTLQTPLAYLALVPVIALLLALARIRLGEPETPIHDRQLDWIVGLGFLGATGAILVLAPQPSDSGFWLRRVDLLTLPLFVAGLTSIFFGVRRLWSIRYAVLFLLLAWPIPFAWLLGLTAGWFTDLTAGAVGTITTVVPVARPAVGDGSLFLIGSGDNFFGVSIGSACSGVNSFVGFLLLGIGSLAVLRGSAIRRASWLAVGLAVTIGLNVARIMAILVVGHFWGQEAAINILHPVAGLVVFNIGVLIMLALAPRFGLRLASPVRAAGAEPERTRTSPSIALRPAMAVTLVIAAVLGLTNAAFARYEAISSGLTDARLAKVDIAVAHVPGWDASVVGELTQARQYFGSDATWERAAYRPTDSASIVADRTVYVDVLTTSDSGTFAAYGLEACYAFHGYEISSVAEVDIGAGVNAQVIDYTNTRNDIAWSALWWEWPFTTEDGATRYQRIVVFMADGPDSNFDGLSAFDIATQDARYLETDQFLASLGQEIVASQLASVARSDSPATTD